MNARHNKDNREKIREFCIHDIGDIQSARKTLCDILANVTKDNRINKGHAQDRIFFAVFLEEYRELKTGKGYIPLKKRKGGKESKK